MLLELEPPRTYKNKQTLFKALEKKFNQPVHEIKYRFIIQQYTDGRLFPVFIGQECLRDGLHFHFNILG